MGFLKKSFIVVIILLVAFSFNQDLTKANAESIKVEGGLIVGERTLLPMRSIFQNLGASVDWEASSQTVTGKKDSVTIQLKINSKTATVNGAQKTLDVPAQLIKDTTYIPVRFVSEALGADVKWDAVTSIVTIQLDGKQLTVPVTRQVQTKTSSGEAFSHSTKTFKVGSRNISANILTVDLNNPRVSIGVALAHDKIGAVENLDNLAKRYGARAAINGTFFNAYTDDAFKQPYGYIKINNKLVNNGDDRAVFAFDSNNRPAILSGPDFKMRQDEFTGAVQAGPTLVRNGKTWVNPAQEGHSDPKILTNGGARSAIGITSDGKLLLVTTNGATIPELAQLMLQAGATQAMNLDGGASSGLYYNGKYITQTGRQISNAILFHYK